MVKKGRTGRPRSKNAKSKQIVVRVTPEMYEKVEEMAENEFTSMGDIVRAALIEEYGELNFGNSDDEDI